MYDAAGLCCSFWPSVYQVQLGLRCVYACLKHPRVHMRNWDYRGGPTSENQ